VDLILEHSRGHKLSPEQLVDAILDIGDRGGAARPGRKSWRSERSTVLGGDRIGDADVLRSGDTSRPVAPPMAPSTLGTFLRSFTLGHVRQPDRVAGAALARAWAAGAGPGPRP
jgi:hypothetical protein